MKSKKRTTKAKPILLDQTRKAVSNGTRAQWIAPLLVAVVTSTTFLVTLSNDFVGWDDDRNLIENFHYRGLGWEQLRWMITTFHVGHYQPLSWVTFGIDYLIWGMDPFGYHLTNLILHTASSVLFYLVSRQLLTAVFSPPDRQGDWLLVVSASLSALLFAIHPLRVESVAWATERRDVLSGLFFFGTGYGYLRAQRCAGDAERRRWMVAALFAYSLSLLAKATAITMPVVLLLLDFYPLKRLRLQRPFGSNSAARNVLGEKVPFLLLALLFAVLALFAQQNAGALRPAQNYFVSYRVGQAFYGLCFYLWKSVVPAPLSPLYELPYDFDAWMPLFLVCGAAVAAVSLALFMMRRRWPALFACWLYYLVVVAPVLGVAQSGPQLVADRYSYLSCLSWALLAGGGFYRFMSPAAQRQERPARFAAATVLASVVLVILSFLTWKQGQIWRDSRTLWYHAIAVGADSAIARYNLARIFEHEGKLQESIESYQRAVTINPTYADAHYNLARLLAKGGRQADAVYHYRRALKFTPNDADTLNNLGVLLALRGETEEALIYLQRAAQANPTYAKAHYNMGKVLAGQGDFAAAIVHHEQAVKLNPDEPEIRVALADALARQGNVEEAILQYQEAVKLRPASPDAHAGLGRLLAVQGRKDEAAQHYQEALRHLKSQQPNPPR